MGKTAKRLFIIILLLAASFSIFGQSTCDPLLVKVNIDSTGCETVQLGTLRFSEFFYAEKNLLEIRDSIPELNKSLRQERKETATIEANLNAEIDTLNSMTTLLEMGREEAINTAVKLEVDNLYLQESLKMEKPKKWWYAAGAVILYEIGRNLLKR